MANSRKHKVIGRTIILTASTNLKKGTKYHGELEGNTFWKDILLKRKSKILLNHKDLAKNKLNPKVVVTGNL